MKKILIVFVALLFTSKISYANISNNDFKNILRTGSPEKVKEALAGGVNMDMKQSLCYSLRYTTQHGVLKVLVDNGADITGTKCFSPVMSSSYSPLWFSTFYKNYITTEDLLKLGIQADDFSYMVANNMQLAKLFVQYSNTSAIEKILEIARANMNDSSTDYVKYREVVSYLQSIDIDMPELKGKNKIDIATQLGQPTQKMDIDKENEMWTYYKHIDDTHYDGSIQGKSYNWGYGMTTTTGSVSNGYTATNSEKYTIIFKNGVVIKAKKNYERQLH